MIIEDIFNLSLSDTLIRELDNIEPTGSVLFIIKLEHKVIKEDVPTHNIIYKSLYKLQIQIK